VESGEKGRTGEQERVSEISGSPLAVFGYLYGWMGVWNVRIGMDMNGYGVFRMDYGRP
jgi:hypothetical protein